MHHFEPREMTGHRGAMHRAGVRLLVLAGLMLVLGLGATGQARADQPVATGTFHLISRTLTLIKTADGNSFYSVEEFPAYAGGLVGTADDRYTLIKHADGSFNAQGAETCTGCTIGGRTGDYTAVFAFSKKTSGEQESRLTFTSGSGGLAGLHGGGTFHATGPGVGVYAYAYNFAP